MTRYLIDTNHLGVALGNQWELRQRMRDCHNRGDKFGTSMLCLFELEAWYSTERQAETAQRRLQSLRKILKIWPIELSLTSIYAALFHKARTTGRVVGFVDLVLIALAQQSELKVLTTDSDFNDIAGIKTENWLIDTHK